MKRAPVHPGRIIIHDNYRSGKGAGSVNDLRNNGPQIIEPSTSFRVSRSFYSDDNPLLTIWQSVSPKRIYKLPS
jgi:hypothetical protein